MHNKINKLSHSGTAPELNVVEWLNTESPMTLAELKGKVVVLYTFQMLCPSCVVHSIPQAMQLHQFYHDKDVQVVGLHTVFEHEEVMTSEALKVFVSEYRIPFPIAIDRPPVLPGKGLRPQTMKEYQLEGTPTLVIIDRQGRIRLNHLGHLGNLEVGNFIGGLLSENVDASTENGSSNTVNELSGKKALGNCDENVCLPKDNADDTK